MSNDIDHKSAFRFTHLLALYDLLREVDPDMPLTYATTFALVAIHEGSTLKDLQDYSGFEQSTVSRNIAALSDRHRLGKDGYGLIETRLLPDNLRFRTVHLKPKGRELVSRINEVYSKYDAALKRTNKAA